MTLAVLGVCLLGLTGVAQAQDRVIGLLKLPEVFGDEPGEPFLASEVKLFATAGSRRAIGSIRADKYWRMDGGVRYEYTRATVHLAAGTNALPTREHDYEAAAAIVLEQRGRWFRVRLSSGTAWLPASARAEFLPLERLLESELAYVTEESDGRLAMFPGEGGEIRVEKNTTVRVLKSRWCGGRHWVYVEALSHPFCESSDKPRVLARGWMPAHGSSGEPSIWFPSRGC
jgi:hypothetical protein